MSVYRILVSNLHNTIGFYNTLLGSRPVRLHASEAEFAIQGHTYLFVEVPEVPHPESFYLVLPTDQFWQLFHRSKHRLLARPGAKCRVVSQAFDLIDPDGHRWQIRVEGSPEWNAEVSFCYLEPLLIQ